MKITKVNNARAAVTRKPTGKGIIYTTKRESNLKNNTYAAVKEKTKNKRITHNPIEGEKDLKNYVEKLNFNAKNLYEVLQSPADKTEFTADELEVLKHFNALIKIKLNPNDQKANNIVKNIPQKTYTEAAQIAEHLVAMTLRKSLRKVVNEKKTETNDIITLSVPEVIKGLIELTCEEGKIENNTLSEEEKALFFRVLEEDYKKTKQIEKIVRSITYQTINVEVVERDGDGKKYLKLANSSDQKHNLSEKKKKEYENKGRTIPAEKQKFVFDFMVDYANKEEVERRKLQSEIKEILELYLDSDTEENVNEEEHSENWKKYFSYKAEKILEEKEKLEKNAADKKDDSAIKTSCKRLNEEARIEVRKSLINAYRNASKKIKGEKERYWLGYFQSVIEKEILSNPYIKKYKLKKDFLRKHAWRTFQSYIALKYADFGKAVYHFVIPDQVKESVAIGEVLEKYKGGITSFDYERIKAEESLERNVATYIAFALHVFKRAVVSPNSDVEDILISGIEEDKNHEKAIKNVFAYFGGYSNWKDRLEEFNGDQFLKDIITYLNNLRNYSFHYTGDLKNKGISDDSMIVKIFEGEQGSLGNIYRKKYYSNNVWMFYDGDFVESLMNYLYSENREIQSTQVPAFENIVKRSSLSEFWEPCLKKNVFVNDRYWSAIYFMLKELYYHGFLNESDLLTKFENALESIGNKTGKEKETQDEKTEEEKKIVNETVKRDQRKKWFPDFRNQVPAEEPKNDLKGESLNTQKTKEQYALDSFKKRIEEIKEMFGEKVTFGQVCQQIVSDFNLQNPNNKEVSVNNGKSKKDKSYKHFPILLQQGIQQAFLEYLKQLEVGSDKKMEVYNILRAPHSNAEECEENLFCKNFKTQRFIDLKEKLSSNMTLPGWYVIAHFLTPKYLNHLVGDIKEYIHYAESIQIRKNYVENSENLHNVGQNLMVWKDVLEILEFVRNFCGQTSNDIQDYFADQEEYANYVSNYVCYGEQNSYERLQQFCNTIADKGPSGKIGIYVDAENPIATRNIVLAKLYGSEELLAKALKKHKITSEDIKEYYSSRNELQKIFECGQCKTKKERKSLSKYQQMKNRVELRNLVTYTEIINDLISQLISWCYLRERDLMYFQLGVSYLYLFYGTSTQRDAVDDRYRKLENGKKVNITEGALLYQICALHTYNLFICKIKGDSVKTQSGGDKYGAVMNKYCDNEEEYKKIFERAMELFQYMPEAEQIRETRNYIDHFKYYAHRDRSIMELYSEIFDRFFNYDLKLKKSVSFLFKNILKNYSVIATTYMKNPEQTKERKKTVIALSDEKGLKSANYSYKLNGAKKKSKDDMVEVEARDEKFLDELRAIIEYRDE